MSLWRRCPRWVVCFVFALGCLSTAKYDEAHLNRMAEINGRYEAMHGEQQRRWGTLLSQVADLRKFLAPIRANSNYSPVERIDTQSSLVDFRNLCDDMDAKASSSPPESASALHELAVECFTKYYRDAYIPALKGRYYKADAAWAWASYVDSKGKSDVEALFAFSHNSAMLSEIQQQEAMIRTSLQRSLWAIEQMRVEEIALSAQQRNDEISEARARHRQTMMALAAAMQNMSQTTPRAAASSTGCTSDFNCGIGNVCVKNNFSSTGYCAKAVNQYGVQTFNTPRLDSVMPKVPVSTDCSGIGDCPVGFSCDLKSGACLK